MFGPDTNALNEQLGGIGTEFVDLEEAFNAAVTEAAFNEAVILMPGCASAAPYPSFKERGQHFREMAERWLLFMTLGQEIIPRYNAFLAVSCCFISWFSCHLGCRIRQIGCEWSGTAVIIYQAVCFSADLYSTERISSEDSRNLVEVVHSAKRWIELAAAFSCEILIVW